MRCFLSLLLFITVASAAGADAPQPFTVERLQAASKAIATIRIPFTQEKHLAIFDEPVVSPGVIEISRPQKSLRWEFTGRSLLILRDGHLRRWGAEGKEEHGLERDPSMAAMTGQMQALLSGDMSVLSELFVVTPDPAGAPALNLSPKSADLARYLTRLELRFRDDLSAPMSLLLVAPGDDQTQYRFAEPQVGIELKPERFAGP